MKDQSHLWAQDFDRQPEDVLNVQDDVAVAVVRDIQLRLTPQAWRKPSWLRFPVARSEGIIQILESSQQ